MFWQIRSRRLLRYLVDCQLRIVGKLQRANVKSEQVKIGSRQLEIGNEPCLN